MMSTSLRLSVLAVAVLIIFIIIQILRKGRVPIKYSLVWLLSAFLILIVAVFPTLLIVIANFMGFQTMSNMVIGILIIVLLFISISLTIIVSGQSEKIKLLIQEVSTLKSKNK